LARHSIHVIYGVLKRNTRILCLIVLLAIIVLEVNNAIVLVNQIAPKENEVKYVSDETWYVPASRNILYKLGVIVHSRVGDNEYATVFLDNVNYTVNVVNYILTHGGKVIKTYSKFAGIAVIGSHELIESIKSLEGVRKVIYGYPYPDYENIDEYYNLEHPPLGKYIIALAMLLLGDNPINWKIPGIIEYAIVTLLVFFIVYKLTGPIPAIVSSIILYFDHMLLNIASVSMLEIHILLFLTLSLFFLVRGRLLLSSIMMGLAGSVKLSGFFPAVALYIIAQYEGMDFKRAFILSFIMPLLVLGVTCFPLYAIFGLETVIINLISSIGWHTSIKHQLNQGPPVSAPWEWFINKNPFYFHFNPDMAAVVNPPIYIFGLVLSFILAMLLANNIRRRQSYPSLYMLSIMFGYVLMYVLGGRTQYSYYASLFTPLVAIIVPQIIGAFDDPCLIMCPLRKYRRLASKVKRPHELPGIVGEFFKWWYSREEREKLLITLMIVSFTFSFLIHLPNENWGLGVPSFYSDVVSIFSRYFAGKSPELLPYIHYDFNRPPMVALTGYLTSIISYFMRIARGNLAEVATFYILTAILNFTSLISIYIDLKKLGRMFNLKVNFIIMAYTLTLIMFGTYDWTLIAAALSLKGLKYAVLKDEVKASTLLALAVGYNPYTIAYAIGAFTYMAGRGILTFLLVLALVNLYPLLGGWSMLYSAYSRFINWYIEDSWMIFLFPSGYSIYAILLSFILSVLVTIITLKWTLKFNFRRGVIVAWALIISYMLTSYVFRPQYVLLTLPLISLISNFDILLFYFFDILNASILIFWWSQGTWSELLFRYRPLSSTSPDALVSWIATFRCVILLLLLLSSLGSLNVRDKR